VPDDQEWVAWLTGTPFALKNIRANRRKPGLLRQYSPA
jgi:RNA 3'-terminal phosphate cyclase